MGIFAAAADITLGTLAATVNTIPEISRNHPDFAKYVNYAALIYGVSRLGYEVYKGVKVEKLSYKDAEKELAKMGIVGSGGELNYIKIISRKMICQEQKMSCGPPCIKQLAEDNGIFKSESWIREIAGTSDLGTSDLGILKGMEKVFEDQVVIGNTFFRKADNVIPSIAKEWSEEGKWIAIVFPEASPRHTIIVDKIINNSVYIRDPWPLEGIITGTQGVEAIIDFDEFCYAWLRGGATGFKIK